MGDALIGQVVLVAFDFAPQGWLPCDGRMLNPNDYQPLYYVIGTTYGGDGLTTFALPNLSGTVAIGMGGGRGLSDYALGGAGGTDRVTLGAGELPAHTHFLLAGEKPGTANVPGPAFFPAASGLPALPYSTTSPSIPMDAGALQPAGGSEPHDNRQPLLCLNYIIAVEGIVPAQA